MGVFGRGQEVQCFMSETDQKEFLSKAMIPNIYVIIGDVHKTKEPKLYNKIPDEYWPPKRDHPNFFLLNKDAGIKISMRYDSEWLKAFRIEQSKSTVVQFLPSVKEGKFLTAGRIAAMLSDYYYDNDRKRHETYQPKSFIEWWESLKSLIKKNFTKCYLLDPITHQKRKVPIWAGEDAVKLYKSGDNLVDSLPQKGYPLMTYHPEKL